MRDDLDELMDEIIENRDVQAIWERLLDADGIVSGVTGDIFYGIVRNQRDSAKCGFCDVKSYCRDIFACPDYSPLDDQSSFTVYVEGKDGGKKFKKGAVPYWNVMYRFAEKLLPPDDGYSDTADRQTRERHMRDLMGNIACVDIVPFASKSDKDLSDGLLDHCWCKFTKKILKLAVAPVVVLVGSKARDTFLRSLPDGEAPSAISAFKRGEIVSHSFQDDAAKYVVAVEHFSGRRGWLQPENYFSGPVLEQLRGAVAQKLNS
jgi:hypothetical protein